MWYSLSPTMLSGTLYSSVVEAGLTPTASEDDKVGKRGNKSGNSRLSNFCFNLYCHDTKSPYLIIHNQLKAMRSHLCCARAASCAPIAELGHQQKDGEWENKARERFWITDRHRGGEAWTDKGKGANYWNRNTVQLEVYIKCCELWVINKAKE